MNPTHLAWPMRRLPPLTALRAFEAAARLGSFRDAAAELCVTPAAISHQVRGLEARCGRPLFRRRPLPIVLTPAGEALFPVIRDGFNRFAAAIDRVRDSAGPERRVHVTTTNAFAARCLVPKLAGWRREHPDVEIDVVGTDAVLDLRGGQADVALRYARHAPRDGPAEELLRDRFHVVGVPLAPGAKGARDWRRRPRIAYDWPPDDTLAPTWARWEAVAGASPATAGRVVMNFREELHAIEAVIAGQGVSICSDLLVRDELADGRLVALSPVVLDGYGLYLVTRPDGAAPGPVRNFCAWLRRTFGAHRTPRTARRAVAGAPSRGDTLRTMSSRVAKVFRS
jgi:LysR family glycine cleavage system transcriptional activator